MNNGIPTTEDFLISFDVEQQQLHKHQPRFQQQRDVVMKTLGRLNSAPVGWFVLGAVTALAASFALKPLTKKTSMVKAPVKRAGRKTRGTQSATMTSESLSADHTDQVGQTFGAH